MSTNGTWVKVARKEGPHSLYAPEKRLTGELLRQMAQSYDPAHRRAKVVCGYDPSTGAAGPAHTMGCYLPTRGLVNALRFDGEYLEAQISEATDHQGKPAITSLVERGFDGVSIKFLPKADLPGQPLYLEHVALLSGEAPGTPGIPPLSDVFRALEAWGVSDGLPFIPAEVPQVGLDGYLSNAYCRSLAECERSWLEPEAPPIDGQPAAKEHEMTPEELDAALTRALDRRLPEVVKSAVDAAVAPLNDGIAAVRTLAEGAKTDAEAAAATARTLAGDSALSLFDSRIDACVASQRVAPGEREFLRETVRALPAEGEARDKFLKTYEARSSMRTLGQPFYMPTPETASLAGYEDRTLTTPNGMPIDAAAEELHQRVWKECKGDQSKYAEAYQRVLSGVTN